MWSRAPIDAPTLGDAASIAQAHGAGQREDARHRAVRRLPSRLPVARHGHAGAPVGPRRARHVAQQRVDRQRHGARRQGREEDLHRLPHGARAGDDGRVRREGRHDRVAPVPRRPHVDGGDARRRPITCAACRRSSRASRRSTSQAGAECAARRVRASVRCRDPQPARRPPLPRRRARHPGHLDRGRGRRCDRQADRRVGPAPRDRSRTTRIRTCCARSSSTSTATCSSTTRCRGSARRSRRRRSRRARRRRSATRSTCRSDCAQLPLTVTARLRHRSRTLAMQDEVCRAAKTADGQGVPRRREGRARGRPRSVPRAADHADRRDPRRSARRSRPHAGSGCTSTAWRWSRPSASASRKREGGARAGARHGARRQARARWCSSSSRRSRRSRAAPTTRSRWSPQARALLPAPGPAGARRVAADALMRVWRWDEAVAPAQSPRAEKAPQNSHAWMMAARCYGSIGDNAGCARRRDHRPRARATRSRSAALARRPRSPRCTGPRPPRRSPPTTGSARPTTPPSSASSAPLTRRAAHASASRATRTSFTSRAAPAPALAARRRRRSASKRRTGATATARRRRRQSSSCRRARRGAHDEQRVRDGEQGSERHHDHAVHPVAPARRARARSPRRARPRRLWSRPSGARAGSGRRPAPRADAERALATPPTRRCVRTVTRVRAGAMATSRG